jgi:hypothetical protein
VRIFIAALFLAAAVVAPAQQPAPAQPPAVPLEAAGELPVNPTELEGGNTPQGDYQGPAILSRGGGPSLGRGAELFRLQPYVSVSGVTDIGLTNTSVDSLGRVVGGDGYGVDTQFGATGSRRWRRSVLDLDVRGSGRHYTNNPYYDGVDGGLSLRFNHQLSRRLTIQFTENAARYSRGYFLTSDMGASSDPTFTGMTSNDLFNSPTTALTSAARLIYQRSARLSFSFAGQGLMARRRSTALIGVNGYGGAGDAAYRVGRHQTLGIDYSFNHYDFQNQYGESDAHGVALNYAIRMGRNWELSVRAGGYRLEASRLHQVTIDPAVAAIIGISVGVEAFHRTAYLPQGGAHLTRSFRRGSLSFGYERTIMPGNGVYMTSGYESASASYSYTGFRRLSLHVSGGSNSFSSMSQTMEKYRGLDFSGGLSYKLNHAMSLVSGVYARQYGVGGRNRMIYSLRVGLSWMPGEYPVAIW